MARRGCRYWKGSILLGLLTCTSALAGGDQKPIVRDLSKESLAHIDWQHPETSPLWKQFALSPGDGATVNLYGITFKSKWSAGSMYLDSADRPSCEAILPKLKLALGSPVEDDGSIVIPFSDTASMKMVMLLHQWDVGNSRVNASCFGTISTPTLPDNPDKLSWTIAIGSQARLPKLVPRFAVRCTRTINYTDGTARPVTELAIWIDPTLEHVTSADGVVIADNGTFRATDSQIAFSMTRNAIKSDYKIDRFTGSLSATITQGDSPAGTISGTCEKSASLGQKF